MLTQELLERVLAKVPDYQTFMTVDELDASSRRLAQEYPGVVSLTEIGKSRSGHPLLCLTIGCGSENAILYGCPHPNEPIGAMMLEAFSRILAEDAELRQALDYTFYIIKVWDVDGVRLNEPGLKALLALPITCVTSSVRRPPRQVDWTFPIDYKNLHFHDTIPETRALQNLIDQLHPRFLYSLHNSAFGGVYWYVTQPLEESFYDRLRGVAAGQHMPIDLGEPEAPYIERLSPACIETLAWPIPTIITKPTGRRIRKTYAAPVPAAPITASKPAAPLRS